MTDFTNNMDLSIHSREWGSQSMSICNGVRRTKCRTVHGRRREMRWYLPGEKINKAVLGKYHFLRRTYNERVGMHFSPIRNVNSLKKPSQNYPLCIFHVPIYCLFVWLYLISDGHITVKRLFSFHHCCWAGSVSTRWSESLVTALPKSKNNRNQ